MFVRPSGRVAAAALALTLTGLAAPVSTATAEPTARHIPLTYAARAQAAASWQADQLSRGSIASPFPGFRDWGLTLDTALALAADGNRPIKLRNVAGTIERAYYRKYAAFEGDVAANAMSKVLITAKVLRKNVRDLDGRNVRLEVLRLILGPRAGREQGRVRDSGESDFSNTFGQSYAVLGLARTGGLPQSAVQYLLRQRCAAGYFRAFESVGTTCNKDESPADVDATALALQAMIAARRSGAAVAPRLIIGTAKWMAGQQRANGSFGGGVGAAAPNTNSTGLAAQALQTVGRTKAAERAASWVALMQITPARAGNGPARRDIGAIALNRPVLRAALRDGITKTTRDQFRRSTPQAYFALDRSSLVTLLAPRTTR